jgi:tetraacyldisaccharide 4'-kinase
LISIPYSWGTRLRNLAFERGWKRSHTASVPVISVGNLTLGGTGKTPCVEYIARALSDNGTRVAILSRGYGSEAGRNDEAMVLEENCPDVPHLQGQDRVALAQTAVEELESEALVLDDGFQHRRLRRDLDIVLIDATCPWGYGYVFPRGLLRESPRGLRRAHLALVTRCDLVAQERLDAIYKDIARWAPNLPIAWTMHQPACWINCDREMRRIEDFQGCAVAAVCGIGNPGAFRKTLESLGCRVTEWIEFPDHHAYGRDDVERLRDWARRLPDKTFVATTQKDLVKLRLHQLGGREVWALKIQLAFRAGEDVLRSMLFQIQPRRGG